MTWHADQTMLGRYVSGDLGDASVLSIEAHLASCLQCRGALPSLVDSVRLDRVWVGVRDVVLAPRRRGIERVLTRLGVREDTARLLVVTPSLQLSWLASMFASLAFAVVASRMFGGQNLPFLVVAPVVPVVGVAWSFGGTRDPVREIGRTTATGGLRLTLIRSVSVVATSIVVTALLSIGLPRAGWAAAAWLLPALALTMLTLAVATAGVATEWAGAGVCAAWLIALLAASGSDPLAAFGPRGQSVVGVLLAMSTAVLMIRRDALETQ